MQKYAEVQMKRRFINFLSCKLLKDVFWKNIIAILSFEHRMTELFRIWHCLVVRNIGLHLYWRTFYLRTLNWVESDSARVEIGSAVFALHIRVTNTQTDRHTDHATCDTCSNRPKNCVTNEARRSMQWCVLHSATSVAGTATTAAEAFSAVSC